MANFIKVAAAVPVVRVAEPPKNVESIVNLCGQMEADGVSLAVFPEMCITGYTCGDLFHSSTLIAAAEEALVQVVEYTRNMSLAFVVGLPIVVNSTMYNVGAVVRGGRIYGLVPKSYVPNYNEFYEKRWWHDAPEYMTEIDFAGQKVLFGKRQIFEIGGVKFGVEICEDLWTPVAPGTLAALAGAEIVLNLSASDALIGKFAYVRRLVTAQSARCISGYVYSSAGFGESSTDLVFDGINMIAQNGRLTAEGKRWHGDAFFTSGVIDLEAIRHDRVHISSFTDSARNAGVSDYKVQNIAGVMLPQVFPERINPMPFVPSATADIAERCDEIINIQTAGLAQRLNSTNTLKLVIGISGGLDSTLALLVAVKTFDRLGLDRKGIVSVTMPGFGTTDRTHDNAVALIGELGTSFREINIGPAVKLHFSDIGHDPAVKDVTYENSQARQRTLVLMDLANELGGMVLGTGDLSELALGWATYNGDHMSMYAVNAGVPKTLVRYLVSRFAQGEAKLINLNDNSRVPEILSDIVDTPISPELIPADENGDITQITEDLVGPYSLHDFFLYYTLRYNLGPKSIFERACIAFAGEFDRKTIIHWLRTFTRRFFTQQFKRSCLPDGPKVGSVCLSPRGDWRMPSDASARLWLDEIERL